MVTESLHVCQMLLDDWRPELWVLGKFDTSDNCGERCVRTVIQGIHRSELFTIQARLWLIEDAFVVEDCLVYRSPHCRKAVWERTRYDVRNCGFISDEQDVQSAMIQFFWLPPTGKVSKEPAFIYVLNN